MSKHGIMGTDQVELWRSLKLLPLGTEKYGQGVRPGVLVRNRVIGKLDEGDM